MNLIKLFSICITVALVAGCSGFGPKLKSWLTGEPVNSANSQDNNPKFSENSSYMQGPKRNYKRATRQKLGEDSQIEGNPGSLWVMEGQGAYLFHQNIMRMVGDPLPVRLEGEPKQQVDGKVDTIVKLMNRLEAAKRRELRAIASQQQAQAATNAKKGEKTKTATAPSTPSATGEGDEDVAMKSGRDGLDEYRFNVNTVPTRIVERTTDGNYRVKGAQPFMIGQREFKVIVTGIVRSEDFSEDGVSATKLLDPKIDIVSVRKKEQKL